MKKAVVFTLGCKVNTCESNSLMAGLGELGFETSDKLGYADLYVINTCAVTAEAEKKSRQTIARARKYNPDCEIIVTGCASEKAPEDFLKKNNVKLVTGAKSKEKILSLVGESGKFITEEDEYGESFIRDDPTKTRAFIKVQDGCDNFCSYCVIPYLRGRNRSREIKSIVGEIESLTASEIVLTGINLSAYGKGNGGLKRLIEAVSPFDKRIRLGSLEVGVIDDGLLSALKNLKNFAEHFHLSLQSGSDSVLKSMNRHYTAEEFREKCGLIRKYFPDAGITTDIIVGYPTESEENFKETLDFAEKTEFSDIHCFPFSPRGGTAAAKLKDLAPEIKEERMAKILTLKEKLKADFAAKNKGKTLDFLPEEKSGEYVVGYTGNYLRCYLKAENFENKIYKVKIGEAFSDGAFAETLED